jgi:hypothetical protein
MAGQLAEPTLSSEEVRRGFLARLSNAQLDALLERIEALTTEEQARGRFDTSPDFASWRVTVDGRVILSSDEEFPPDLPPDLSFLRPAHHFTSRTRSNPYEYT